MFTCIIRKKIGLFWCETIEQPCGSIAQTDESRLNLLVNKSYFSKNFDFPTLESTF